MKNKTKRILTDIAGYLLILLGISIGWLPGPGGIPAVLAGLSLLSINNLWARRLRDHLLAHGGRVVEILFPKHRPIQILYDLIVILLLVIVGLLAWQRAAIWQIGLAIGLFFLAFLIASLNRDRATRLKKSVAKRKN